MIRHVFFDAGGTLVFPNLGLVGEKLAALGARVAPEELQRGEQKARFLLDDPEVIKKSSDGVRWNLYFEMIFKFCGVTDAPVVRAVLDELQRIHKESNLWEIVPPEVPRALQSLRGRVRMSVISNANGTVREKLRRVGLLEFFETVLDSHEEGIEKPDPRIFRAALERTGTKVEEALYVGDIYHIDVVGARAAGMDVILLDPADLYRDKPVRRLPGVGALPSSIDAP